MNPESIVGAAPLDWNAENAAMRTQLSSDGSIAVGETAPVVTAAPLSWSKGEDAELIPTAAAMEGYSSPPPACVSVNVCEALTLAPGRHQ